MFSHKSLWEAIDRLAAIKYLSPSGLARRAGLDSTSFNKSKRTSVDGKPRWPSTESLSKILDVTGLSMAEFAKLVEQAPPIDGQRIPVIGNAQAGQEGYFDDGGYPTGSGWDEVLFPNLGDPHVFALEISGTSMEPCYRDGDLIIVAPNAQIRRADRVVAKTRDGEVMAKHLQRQTATSVELASLNPDFPDRTLSIADVLWISRIVWVSQ